jgi:glycosyltransferase involved in cell wall biosynthesis
MALPESVPEGSRPPPVSPLASLPAFAPSLAELESSDDFRKRGAYDHVTLLMAPELFSSVGGIPRILQLYLKALCDLGAERNEGVRVAALNDPALDTIDLRRYTNSHLDNWFVCNRNKRRFVRASLKLARGCDRLICGHVAQLPVAWLARLLNPRLRYYLIAHGIEVWRPFTLLERIALRGAARVFCVSEYTRGELLRHCRLRPGRAIVLPNALDPIFEEPPAEPLAARPPVILTATRLTYSDRYKGVDQLIAAMPAVRAAEPEAQLRIVGRGNDLPRLQGIARQHRVLGAGVEFLGGVDDKQLRQELRRSRLFALPSKSEGFGLVFLEAMAQGCPCLGARAGGTPEVITPETGTLVEFGDIAGISAACVESLRREWSREALLARARLFSFANFKQRLAEALNH